MCRSSFKYNLTFIVLFIGITLVHAGDGDDEPQNESASADVITLYYIEWSVPCRAVLMLAKSLNVELKFVQRDVNKKRDQPDPEYEKIHPLRKVPAINDNGFILWESRAILVYLARKFGPKNGIILFPADIKEQAVVNKMLQFDMGTLTAAYEKLYGFWALYKTPKTEFKQTKLLDALQIFDTILEKESYEYAAGKSMTVADVALFANIITIKASGQVDLTMYTNITKWYTKCDLEMTEWKKINETAVDIITDTTKRRNEEELKDLDDGSVSNRDVFTALSTVLSGVRSQVLATKHFGYFKSLMDNVTPFVKRDLRNIIIN